MHMKKKISVLLLTAILTAQIFTGCSAREEASDSLSSSGSSSSSSSSQAKPESDGTVSSITPDFSEDIDEAFEDNEDTIGWLQVPGTNIEDVVVHKPDDKTNLYYERLDFYGNYNFNGVYWTDYRCTFGDGSREQLGVNTTIYGHALTDDEEKENYDVKFGHLHDFRNPEFAKSVPYMNFSTAKENMIFEVFAVFLINADNLSASYNDGSKSQEEYLKIVREEILPRSKYNYDVEIKDDDKFLTLSTCIYTLDDGTVVGYPNYYRFCIMGKLLDPDEPLKKEAVFTENEDVIIDPDGKWNNQ